jgi:glyoxylase-like metal-dependent hydrolase (beta-lactamase superfamily II)
LCSKPPLRILESLDLLGAWPNCLYLLKGEEAMIVGGGMSWIAPALEKQFAELDFDSSRIRYLVITHSHFDHCGAVPYLKRKFPRAKILASAYAQRVFSLKKAVQFIAAMNDRMLEKTHADEEAGRLNLKFDGIQVDQTISDQDFVDLGNGITVRFLETPGHTQCSLAAYVPSLKILFPSDAAAFPSFDGKGAAHPSPQYDFPLYLGSLKKLAALEVEILAFEHHGFLRGAEARQFLIQATWQAEENQKFITENIRRPEDFEPVVQKLAGDFLEQTRFLFLPPEIQKSVAATVVRKILEANRE